MSEYYTLVNYTREEIVDPHTLEQPAHLGGWFHEKLATSVLVYLITNGNNFSGGDFAGLWTRDNIELVGDYTEIDISEYDDISDNVFTELTHKVDSLP